MDLSGESRVAWEEREPVSQPAAPGLHVIHYSQWDTRLQCMELSGERRGDCGSAGDLPPWPGSTLLHHSSRFPVGALLARPGDDLRRHPGDIDRGPGCGLHDRRISLQE